MPQLTHPPRLFFVLADYTDESTYPARRISAGVYSVYRDDDPRTPASLRHFAGIPFALPLPIDPPITGWGVLDKTKERLASAKHFRLPIFLNNPAVRKKV